MRVPFPLVEQTSCFRDCWGLMGLLSWSIGDSRRVVYSILHSSFKLHFILIQRSGWQQHALENPLFGSRITGWTECMDDSARRIPLSLTCSPSFHCVVCFCSLLSALHVGRYGGSSWSAYHLAVWGFRKMAYAEEARGAKHDIHSKMTENRSGSGLHTNRRLGEADRQPLTGKQIVVLYDIVSSYR